MTELDHLVISEMGLALRRAGDGFSGEAVVVPELLVPGRTDLRASAFVIWADTIGAAAASAALWPRAVTTADLTLDLHRPVVDSALVRTVATVVKIGRQLITTSVEFRGEDGTPLGVASLGLMASPDGTLARALPSTRSLDEVSLTRPLPSPLAERVACGRTASGTAVLPKTQLTTNALNTINGGLHALVVEEAVLAAAPDARIVSMALRYLRPARVGPAVATASLQDGLARVSVVDSGEENREVVLATVRYE
jgi:acyl-coenzyme A thioesterase PaaI-like protein